MKFISVLLLAASASAAAVHPRHHKGVTAAATTAKAAKAAATAGAAVAAAGGTVVLFEVAGVPGNECITFRNNGEMVDAACVNTAADRQLTTTTIGGAAALKVQRTFTAGFRADLVSAEACVGFNGTTFLAEPCTKSGVELVSFTGGQLKAAGGACASGHDGAAQLTVDTTGKTCAKYTSTSVTPTTA